MEPAERNNKPVTFNLHLYKREINRRLLDKIQEIVKTGKVEKKKSEFPKVCLTRYYGKENKTYFVIIVDHKELIEVITSWTKKGR